MADRLLELLLKDGVVSEEVAQRALDRQEEAGGALDTALLETGLVDGDALEGYLARAAGLPAPPPSAWTATDARARRVFPAKVAERHGVVPFALEGRELSVVTAYPPDLGLLDEISFMLSLHLRPHVAPEWRIRGLVQHLYGTPMPQRLAAIAAAESDAGPGGAEASDEVVEGDELIGAVDELEGMGPAGPPEVLAPPVAAATPAPAALEGTPGEPAPAARAPWAPASVGPVAVEPAPKASAAPPPALAPVTAPPPVAPAPGFSAPAPEPDVDLTEEFPEPATGTGGVWEAPPEPAVSVGPAEAPHPPARPARAAVHAAPAPVHAAPAPVRAAPAPVPVPARAAPSTRPSLAAPPPSPPSIPPAPAWAAPLPPATGAVPAPPEPPIRPSLAAAPVPLPPRPSPPAPAAASRAPPPSGAASPAARGGTARPAAAAAMRPAGAAAPASLSGPGWTLGEARAALASARDRDEAIVAALRYARDFFEYAAMFAVTRDALYGHEALGREEGARDECRRVAAELSDPGFFRIPIETRGPYLGPPPLDPVTAAILAGMRRATPRTVLLHPVFVRERAVGVLYADNGEAPVSARRLGDLFLVLGSLGGALERVIRERKLHPPSGLDEETWRVTEPARIADEPLPIAVDVDLGDYEVATAAEALSSPRALDLPAAVEALARSARGSAERSALVGTLAQRGPEAAAMLVARLPGPIEVPAGLSDATPVQEHGPIPAAVLALGAAAQRPLGAALSDPDPDRRRYAALLLGAAGDAGALPGLAVRVFDEDPGVAAAAREALAAARGRPELRPVTEGLRRELASGKAARAIQAVRALARLGDAEAVPVLIQLLEAGGEMGAVASDALVRITLQRLGSEPSRWLAWWQGRRGTPRSRWLLEALTSPDRDVRQAAADELRQAGTPPVPYFADAPAPERERAARAWADWWQESGRVI